MFIIFTAIENVLQKGNGEQKSTGLSVLIDDAMNSQALNRLTALIKIIQKKGEQVGIVITDNMRIGASVNKLKKIFADYDFSDYIFGKITDREKNTADDARESRIQDWLDTHQILGITNHIIFDGTQHHIKSLNNFIPCTEGILEEKEFQSASKIANQPSLQHAFDTKNQCVNASTILALESQQSDDEVIKLYEMYNENLWDDHCRCCLPVINWVEQQPNKQIHSILNNVQKTKTQTAIELNNAIKKNEIKALDQLLEQKPHLLNFRNDSGATLLYCAVFYNHTELAIYLINKNADARLAVIHTGFQPSHLAAYTGKLKILQALYQKDPSLLNERDNDDQTPLHLATSSGTSTSAALFLSQQNNIDLDAVSSGKDNNMTTLHIALSNHQKTIATNLINVGANLKVYSTSEKLLPIHVAASTGQQPILQLLLKKDSSLVNLCDGLNRIALHHAVESDELECTQYLLTQGSDVNSITRTLPFATPLDIAMKKKNNSIIQELKAVGAINTIHFLIKLGDLSGIKKLVTQYPTLLESKNEAGETPLVSAIICGMQIISSYLIYAGANLNVYAQRSRFLPIHMASFYKQLFVLKEILKKDASMLNTTDYFGKPPIRHALNDKDTFNYLLDQSNINLNIIDYRGLTVLDRAKEMKKDSMVSSLIKKGAKTAQELGIAKNPSSFFASSSSDSIAAASEAVTLTALSLRFS